MTGVKAIILVHLNDHQDQAVEEQLMILWIQCSNRHLGFKCSVAHY